MAGKWRVITLICICQVLVMALWFSTTAVVPSLQRERPLTPFHVSLLTSGVQIGFVAGTLISAFLGFADRLDPRRFYGCGGNGGCCQSIDSHDGPSILGNSGPSFYHGNVYG